MLEQKQILKCIYVFFKFTEYLLTLSSFSLKLFHVNGKQLRLSQEG